MSEKPAGPRWHRGRAQARGREAQCPVHADLLCQRQAAARRRHPRRVREGDGPLSQGVTRGCPPISLRKGRPVRPPLGYFWWLFLAWENAVLWVAESNAPFHSAADAASLDPYYGTERCTIRFTPAIGVRVARRAVPCQTRRDCRLQPGLTTRPNSHGFACSVSSLSSSRPIFRSSRASPAWSDPRDTASPTWSRRYAALNGRRPASRC